MSKLSFILTVHTNIAKIVYRYSESFLCFCFVATVLQIFAEVSGLDVEIIRDARTYLQVLFSGQNVRWERFHEFGIRLYRKIVAKYPFYYVSSSVHSLLLHAAPLMEDMALPPKFYDEGEESVVP